MITSLTHAYFDLSKMRRIIFIPDFGGIEIGKIDKVEIQNYIFCIYILQEN